MSQPALFHVLPKLVASTPWVWLTDRTPSGRLSLAGKRRRHDRLFVKRTAPLYSADKVRNLVFTFFAILALLGMSADSALAQPLGAITNFAKRVSLTVERIDHEVPVEHEPMRIYFRVDNNSDASASGWVAADVFAGNDCTRFSTFWRIHDLQPGASGHGAVVVQTPRAGQNRRYNVYYFVRMVDGSRTGLCPATLTRSGADSISS